MDFNNQLNLIDNRVTFVLKVTFLKSFSLASFGGGDANNYDIHSPCTLSGVLGFVTQILGIEKKLF